MTKSPPDRLREDYAGRPTFLPEIPHVGWTRFPRALRGHLAPHRHVGCYEICYIVQGPLDWWAGDKVYEVGPGQVYFTRPEELHGGVNAVMNPCEIYWLQVRMGGAGALPGLTLAQTRELAAGLARMRQRCFPGSSTLPALFEAVLAEYRNPALHGEVAGRAALHMLLVTVLRDQARHVSHVGNRPGGLSPAIQKVITVIEAEEPTGVTVAALARQAGLSLSRFRQRFAQETGFAPSMFLMRRKIRQAKERLRLGEPVTRVAMRLGFASSQHLATAFKKWVGVTPTEYHRLARSETQEIAP